MSNICSSTIYKFKYFFLLTPCLSQTQHVMWSLVWVLLCKWSLVLSSKLIAASKSTSHVTSLFYSLVRKRSSQVSFSVILHKNLSSFWIDNSWNFINNLQHCEVFAVRQPLTFFDHNKISSCAFIIFIMSKIHFSFIEELKSKHNQR